MNLTTRRAFLALAHLLCAIAAGLALLSQEDLPSNPDLYMHTFSYWVVGPAVVPALWPFILSYVGSRRLVPSRAAYLAIYSSVLVLSTLAGSWFVLRSSPVLGALSSAFLASVVQAVAFAIAILILRGHADRHGTAY